MKLLKLFIFLIIPLFSFAQNQLTLVKDISPGYNKEFGIYFELNTDGTQLYLRSRYNGIYRFDPDSKSLNKIKNSYPQKYIPPFHSSGTIKDGEFYFVHNDLQGQTI